MKTRLPIPLFILAIVFASPVQSASITEEQTFTGVVNDGSTPVSIPDFNPALGTLTLVEVGFNTTASFDAYEIITNGEPVTIPPMPLCTTVDFSAGETGHLAFSVPVTDASLAASGSASGCADPYSSVVVMGVATGSSVAEGSLPKGLFPDVTGTGSSTFDFSVTAIFFNNIAFSGATETQGTVSITYDYTPTVPEPRSIGLIGIGAAALFWQARHKLGKHISD